MAYCLLRTSIITDSAIQSGKLFNIIVMYLLANFCSHVLFVPECGTPFTVNKKVMLLHCHDAHLNKLPFGIPFKAIAMYVSWPNQRNRSALHIIT